MRTRLNSLFIAFLNVAASTQKLGEMKRLFLLCVVAMCVVFSFRAQGQETISIGERHTLFSRLLNEERAYWVYQPEKRPGETEQNYPVLYLLDGDSFFHTVVGFTRFFSSSKKKRNG